MTALHWAALAKSEATVELLFNCGATMPTPLKVFRILLLDYKALTVSEGRTYSSSFRRYTEFPRYSSVTPPTRS